MERPRPVSPGAVRTQDRGVVGIDRRAAIVSGLGVLAGLALSRHAGALPTFARRSRAVPPGDPILRMLSLGDSVNLGGLPTSPTWFGDAFPSNDIPFHQCESCDGAAPPIDEHVDAVVIGGGLAGLASAYGLRHRRTVLMEMRPRLGGNAMGESWRSLAWSQGSAYFMTPEPDTPLERLYRAIGVDRNIREDSSPTTFSWDSAVTTDLLGPRPTEQERRGLERYIAAVDRYWNDEYPDIPFDGKPGAIVQELDQLSFRAHIESVCRTVPPRLAYAIQAYCTSSFGVGSDEISAAAGWNFVAAEEGGRWVMRGGNAGLARALWRAVTDANWRGGDDGFGSGHGDSHHGQGVDVRAGAMATLLERAPDGVIVRWRQADGRVRRMHAQHVVCAAPKHVVRFLMPWLATEDSAKLDAVEQVHTVPYLVGNVILSAPVPRELYDLFMSGGPAFPMEADAFASGPVITDVLNGSFAGGGPAHHSVLTAYWPLPWHTARFEVVAEDAWRAWAERAGSQIAEGLRLVGLSAKDVLQVRWSRWGHAMPIPRPCWLTSGAPELLRRPLLGRIWFANQDNWMLPAVETSLTEGLDAASHVNSALG